MVLVESESFFAPHNPVDTFEDVVVASDWTFERPGDEELSVTLKGSWCDYHISVTWHPSIQSLHLSATLDVKVPETRRNEVYALLALINEQQWIGHFDLWSEESFLLFRLTLPLHGVQDATSEQCEALMQVVVEACERYYPAFQFVLWAGKTAREALEASLFDTVGSA